MAEDTKVETEITADDLVETPAEVETSDAGQAEPTVKKTEPHEFDKVRQQVQQEIGNKVRPIEAKLDALLAKIEAQGDVTPAQKKEVEKLSAQVDELDAIADTDPDKADPYKGMTVVARRLKKLERDLAERQKVLDQRLAEADRSGAQARQLAFEHNWKNEFARVNPDLKDKSEEAYRDYADQWSKWVGPDANLDEKTARQIATNIYGLVLDKYKDSPTADPSTAKTNEPAKSTRGTQIATGSSARRTVDNKKEPSDDDLIAGFFNDPNA